MDPRIQQRARGVTLLCTIAASYANCDLMVVFLQKRGTKREQLTRQVNR
jgi:hypothetical protein